MNENLKSAITAVVKQNGANEITGQNLQSVLVAIVDTLGRYGTFVGLAQTGTTPVNYDGNIFYIAAGKGTYSGFGLTVNDNELAIFSRAGSGAWQKLSVDAKTKINDGEITTAMLANGAVTTAKLADGAVTTPKIGNGAVTSSKLADYSVTTSKIMGNAITTDLIDDLAVTRQKIAPDAVTQTQLADGEVLTSKIRDGNVTTAKIADGNVTTAKLADGAVTTPKINNSAVTSEKLADGAVTQAKLASDVVIPVDIADGSVTTAKLADDAVTADKMAWDAVQRSNTWIPQRVFNLPQLTDDNAWHYLEITSSIGITRYSVTDTLYFSMILLFGTGSQQYRVRMFEPFKKEADQYLSHKYMIEGVYLSESGNYTASKYKRLHIKVSITFPEDDPNAQSLNVEWKDVSGDYYARLTDFSLTDLQAAVAAGNLERYGLKPGDQKTINGHTYVIAGLNPMKGTTTPYRLTQNHVGLIVIPHTTLAWNADGKTTEVSGGHGAGYANSELHAYLQSDILPMCQNDLGAANLLAHSKLLTTAVNATGVNRFGEATGCSSSWGWVSNQYISALSEVQVYGGTVWSSSGFDTGEACRQLEVFQRYSHTEIFGGEYPWLRDVVSASNAAYATDIGGADYNAASFAFYVAALILFK